MILLIIQARRRLGHGQTNKGLMDKYLSEAKLNWAQKELLQKLQDAAERHKRLVLLKGRRFN